MRCVLETGGIGTLLETDVCPCCLIRCKKTELLEVSGHWSWWVVQKVNSDTCLSSLSLHSDHLVNTRYI